MYETIDEIDEVPLAPVRRRNRLWVSFAILAGVSILTAAAMFAGQDPVDDSLDQAQAAAEEGAYRAALTDASPAMRRARLTDFLDVYPKSARRVAVKAQLQVIAQAEAQDWAALTQVIFDTEQTQDMKRAVLQAYESVWDTALLGGREDDVARTKASLSQDKEPLPDRDLPIDPESIPKGVPGDTLLGGAGRSRSGYNVPPPPVFYPHENDQGDVIIPPRIRKNRTPKYPRRALERGAEAVVILDLFVDARGRVEMTELISIDADGYDRDFIRAAERAAMRTRYYPKTRNGTPVPTQAIEKIYSFEIED